MKKSLLLLLVAMSVCLGGFAQKGMQAVGVDVSPAYHFRLKVPGVGIGFKYSYNLTDFIKLTPNVKYSLAKRESNYHTYGTSTLRALQLGADLDVFLTPNRRTRPYLATGIYYFKLTEDADSSKVRKASATRPSANLGIGLEYRFTYKVSLQTEFTYNLPIGNHSLCHVEFEDLQALKIGIGITYYL